MRKPLFTATVAACLAFATACSAAPEPEPAVGAPTSPLRIVSGQLAQNGELLRKLLQGFDDANSDISLDIQLDNKKDVEISQSVIAQIQAGNAPDLVRVTSATFRAFTDAGVAKPLTTCFESDSALLAAVDREQLDNLRVKGEIYAAPWYVTKPALFVNDNAFREAGLDPRKAPATWAEIEEAAAKLAAPERNRFGALTYFGNSFLFQGGLFSGGGTMVDSAGKAPEFNGQAGTAVLQHWRNLVDRKQMPVVDNYFAEAVDMFKSGKVPMLVSSSSTFTAVRSAGFPISVAPFPVPAGGSRKVPVSINGFVMLTADPARQAAVCKLVKSLLTPQAVTDTVKATATAPLNKQAGADPALLGGYFAENPGFAAVNAQPSTAWYTFPGSANAEFEVKYAEAQFAALRGTKSPKEALDAAAARMLGK